MRAGEDPSVTECDEGGDAPCWAHLFENAATENAAADVADTDTAYEQRRFFGPK